MTRSKQSPFTLGAKAGSRPADPEAVFADLRPADEMVKHLWSHQADTLREYHKNQEQATDVALELPTGMGKTLVGLLLGEYRRRALDERVVYLCPTKQLARQVHGQAASYGIGTALLVGPQKDYPQQDYARYASAEAVAITTYKGVFNTNPRLHDPHVLVLDDAHSGGEHVADLWSFSLTRDQTAYRGVVELFADTIPHPFLTRLRSDDIDPRDRRDVYKLPTEQYVELSHALAEYLDAAVQGDSAYGWRMVREHLAATHLYLSWWSLQIRPLIPPTLRHNAFANARQRVYMSATLGAGGELERLMGVEAIRRIPVPENWESQRTGRRFILFPSFSLEAAEVSQVLTTAVSKRERTLVICPSRQQADAVAQQLKDGTRVAVLDSTAIEDSLVPFSDNDHAALVLAARYDGIDLPDQSCRQLALVDLPSALNLQERFLTDKLRAEAVLRDRIRTRITQGVGRCTRNPRDYAAVLLCGADLLGFCLRRENRQGMPRELQAEMRFGLSNSQATSIDELIERLDVFFEQGDAWTAADAEIRELRKQCNQEPDPVAAQLMRVVHGEVRYSYNMWDGDFEGSLQRAREVGDGLGGDELRNYRAWWLYLASSAATILSKSGAGPTYEVLARELLDRGRAAASVSWIRGLGTRGSRVEAVANDELTVVAAESIAARLQELGFVGPKFEGAMAHLQGQLRERSPDAFHAGMECLGELLGFRSFRPAGTGSPDVVWRLEPEVALVWEAKSQVGENEPISLSTARQCVGHANGARELLHLRAGEECFVVVACHRAQTAREAITQVGDTRVFSIPSILELAEAITSTLRRTRGRAGEGSDSVALVREDLIAAGLEPRNAIRRVIAVVARDVPAS